MSHGFVWVIQCMNNKCACWINWYRYFQSVNWITSSFAVFLAKKIAQSFLGFSSSLYFSLHKLLTRQYLVATKQTQMICNLRIIWYAMRFAIQLINFSSLFIEELNADYISLSNSQYFSLFIIFEFKRIFNHFFSFFFRLLKLGDLFLVQVLDSFW